jgi:hypothetical protein
MKKIFDYSTLSIDLAVAVGMDSHFNVEYQVTDFLTVVVYKPMPWIKTVIYS